MPKSPPGAKPRQPKAEAPSQKFVDALKAENLKLQRQIAKLEAEQVSARNRIKVLEELKPEGALRTKPEAELRAELEDSLEQLGYQKKKS